MGSELEDGVIPSEAYPSVRAKICELNGFASALDTLAPIKSKLRFRSMLNNLEYWLRAGITSDALTEPWITSVDQRAGDSKITQFKGARR